MCCAGVLAMGNGQPTEDFATGQGFSCCVGMAIAYSKPSDPYEICGDPSKAALISVVPKPVLVGGCTGGPPRSIHEKEKALSSMPHRIEMWPSGAASAPYLVAF